MCLKVNNELTRRGKARKREWVWRYKAISWENQSPYFYSQWKVGIVKSNRKTKDFLKSEKDSQGRCFVQKGIHVCKSIDRALYHANTVIKVKCFTKDLVACGLEEEVYMKVTVESLDGVPS